MDLDKIPDEKFESLINIKVNAKRNAEMALGKFPAIIMRTEPESLSVTNEFLASHGFVVIGIDAPNDQGELPDSLQYNSSTEDMEWLLTYTEKLDFIDPDKLAIMGFGGGTFPAFFLCMKSDKFKAFISVEGGIFGKRFLASKSVYYHPDKLITPTLQIVTKRTRSYETNEELNVLKNARLYHGLLQNEKLRHHDFSIFGRTAIAYLQMQNSKINYVDTAYVAVHEIILEFLNGRLIKKEPEFKPQKNYAGILEMNFLM